MVRIKFHTFYEAIFSFRFHTILLNKIKKYNAQVDFFKISHRVHYKLNNPRCTLLKYVYYLLIHNFSNCYSMQLYFKLKKKLQSLRLRS